MKKTSLPAWSGSTRNGEGVDILVNNAGFGLYGPMEDIPLDDAR